MVSIQYGRFIFPDNILYDKKQHVFLNPSINAIGLDQLGFFIVGEEPEVELIEEESVKIGKPFAKISSNEETLILKAPCSGKIKEKNNEFLRYINNDTYTKGYIVQLESVEDLDRSLISGDEVCDWAREEEKRLFPKQYKFKIIVRGMKGVGKTSIRNHLTDGYFIENPEPTQMLDMSAVRRNSESTGDATVEYTFWEITDDNDPMECHLYAKGADGVVLVFSIDSSESLENIKGKVEDLEGCFGTGFPVLVIGNKKDLGEKRQVSTQEAESFATEHGYRYVELSAKNKDEIENIFDIFASDIANYIEERGC